jgi:hypothetical protein
VAVEGRGRNRVAETEAVKLERLVVPPGVVDLVREEEDGPARPAQDRGDLLVPRRDPRRRIHDEEDEVGLLDRPLRLLRDLTGDRRVVGDVDAPRVDEEEAPPVPLAHDLLTVARYPRGLEDHRLPGRREPVHERRLAHVREADDGNRA